MTKPVDRLLLTSESQHLNSIYRSDWGDTLAPDWLWRGLHQTRRTPCLLLLCCHISPVYFSSFAVWQELLVSAAACHIRSWDVRKLNGSRWTWRKHFTWNKKCRHTSGTTERAVQDSRMWLYHRRLYFVYFFIYFLSCFHLFVFFWNISCSLSFFIRCAATLHIRWLNAPP